MGRRIFSREFKVEAVRLVTERGVSITQAAQDLGIGGNMLGRWVREAKADQRQAFPGRGQMKPDDAEVARLKRELARTRAERDILKKPSATWRRSRREIRGDCPAPWHLATELVMRHAAGDAGWVLRLAEAAGERESATGYAAHSGDSHQLRRE